MGARQLRLVYNGLFIVVMALTAVLLGVFALFLYYAFTDILSSAIDGLTFPLLLLIAAILCILAVMFAIVILIAVRFNFMIQRQLDADSAKSMFTEFMTIFGRRKSSPGYHVLASQILDLEGSYEEALKEFTPKKTVNSSQRNKLRMAYFHIRCGRIEDALSIYRQLEVQLEKKPTREHVQLHTIGLCHLESGNLENAKECFIVASYLERIAVVASNITRLNCAYDFARLHEMEGNLEKAKECYAQAAALGPKTWLGQEAARRLEVLVSH